MGYIFEARHVNGSRLHDDEHLTEEDIKVREAFTQIIADFARHGKIQVGGKEVPSFSDSDNNFLQISATPKVAKNFRFCEMALWAGLAQRLQNPLCQLIASVKNVPGTIINATKLDVISGGFGTSVMKNLSGRNKTRNPLGFL